MAKIALQVPTVPWTDMICLLLLSPAQGVVIVNLRLWKCSHEAETAAVVIVVAVVVFVAAAVSATAVAIVVAAMAVVVII